MPTRTTLTIAALAMALVTGGVRASNEPGDKAVTNRLAKEKSPYLLQHAANPVDWYPWGEEAFEKARKEDKPIFLSIGYATCHWCHVMEHESFEDPVVAALMNEAFVNIKVDREERPDVDQVYMTVCQMLTGSGGWPLTIVMTPDKKPFFAGTYLPRESRQGRIGMVDLVPRVQQMWQSDRDTLLESAQQIVGHLQNATTASSQEAPPADLPKLAYTQLEGRFDARNGGFGERPKFPSPHNLIFLLRYGFASDQSKALEMTEYTLEAMRLGGIYDQIGFGFHRYSTDREWLVPHFEKMLYDQAMLVLAYTEAFQVAGNPEYRHTAREVLTYVLRDMTSADGGFYSAEDADSEGEEGLFYLWTVDEIREVLSDRDAAWAIDVWNLSKEGNYLDEATGRETGTNIPHLQETLDQAADRLEMDRNDFRSRYNAVRETLFDHREARIHPLKDDKVLADWNGLMAAAMARAGQVFGEPRYVEAARDSVEFVLTNMRDGKGRLFHRFRDGEAAIGAFLDDYAFLTWACLELYDTTFDVTYLSRALDLQDRAIEFFWDDDRGGFYLTADGAESLLVRPKEVYDGAMPSGNSVAMANLIRLGRLTGRIEFSDRARALETAFGRELRSAPSGHTHMISASLAASGPSLEIVVAGDPGSDDAHRLIETIRSAYLPNAVTLVVPDGAAGEAVRKLAPFTEHHSSSDGKPAAYVCRDFACKLPTTDPAQLAALLKEAASAIRGGGHNPPGSSWQLAEFGNSEFGIRKTDADRHRFTVLPQTANCQLPTEKLCELGQLLGNGSSNIVDRLRPIDLDQLGPIQGPIKRRQHLGLGVIVGQPVADGVFLVVISLDQGLAREVVHALDLWRVVDHVVDPSGLRVGPPARQALDDVIVWNHDLHHGVDRHSGLAHGLCLRQRPREAIEQETVGTIIGRDSFLHQPDNHVVGYQTTGIHGHLGLQTEFGARRDRCPEHVAG